MSYRTLALALAATTLAFSQTPKARIKIDTDRTIGEVHPHLFGNFAEHLGRCIYGGLYEEGSPLSDTDGYRKDVMQAVKGLGVTRAALARRQLRIRLQLEGRHRSEGSAPGSAGPGAGAIWSRIDSAPTSF